MTDDASGGFLGCKLPRNQVLLDQGWSWSCNTDPVRVREVTDTYEELGFEVRLEPIDLTQLSADCNSCMDVMRGFSAVYVRKKG